MLTWEQYSWHTFGPLVGADKEDEDEKDLYCERDAADQSHLGRDILAGYPAEWWDQLVHRLA